MQKDLGVLVKGKNRHFMQSVVAAEDTISAAFAFSLFWIVLSTSPRDCGVLMVPTI